MFRYVFALAILGAVVTPVRAQDVIPDLKGTWTGKGQVDRLRQQRPSCWQANDRQPASGARH